MHCSTASGSSTRFRLYSECVNAVQELLQLTPVYEDVDGGWTQVRLAEMPGVITAAPTREQARELLLDALREFLLSFGPNPPEPAMATAPDAVTLTIRLGAP